jgi:hypothetical protein
MPLRGKLKHFRLSELGGTSTIGQIIQIPVAAPERMAARAGEAGTLISMLTLVNHPALRQTNLAEWGP